MTTLTATVLVVLVVALAVFIFILAWSSERTKRIIFEREENQQQQVYSLNKAADAHLEQKKHARPNIIGDSVDDLDPWRGLRTPEINNPPKLHNTSTPKSTPKN